MKFTEVTSFINLTFSFLLPEPLDLACGFINLINLFLNGKKEELERCLHKIDKII